MSRRRSPSRRSGQAHPGQGRRLRHVDPGAAPAERGLLRRARPDQGPARQQRSAQPDAARAGRGNRHRVRRGRRRHPRHQHLQRQCHQPGRLWRGGPCRRHQPRGGADHPHGRRPLFAKPTASRAGSRARSGPTNKTLSLSPDVNDPAYREVDFDTMKAVYREQVDALVEGGVDFILIETIFDTLERQGRDHGGARGGARRWGEPLPLMISMTLTDLSGRNLSGHTVEAFWASVRHARPVTIGLNCSFGAAQLRPHLAALAARADTLVMAYPNAGLPNELGEYDEAAAETAAQVARMDRRRAGQHRRRLLRDDARAYRRDRRGGAGSGAARRFRLPTATPCSPASSRWCSRRDMEASSIDRRRGRALRQYRRADQRHRFGQIQETDPRRRL